MPMVMIELADDEVLVALKRGEGYDDVHPQLVSEDAISTHWPEWRTILPEQITPVHDGQPPSPSAGIQA